MAKGGKRPGAGRPKKADEQRLRDMLSPYRDEVVNTVIDIMRTAKRESDRLAAAKLLMSYDWGQPPQHVDHTTQGGKIEPPVLMWAGQKISDD